MARINIVISDDIDQKFRKTVADRLGLKKGNIKIAVEEALTDWIKRKHT